MGVQQQLWGVVPAAPAHPHHAAQPGGVHLVHHGLKIRIVAGVDTQAAPLKSQVDLPVGPVPLLGQRVPHVGDDGLLIPGVYLCVGLRLLIPGKAQLLGHRLVVLLPADHPLLQHLVDPVCPLLQIPAAALEDQPLTAMHRSEFLFFDLSDHDLLLSL